MPVHVTVSEVRDAVRAAAGFPAGDAAAESSTAALGRAFHACLASLASDDEVLGWRAAVTNADRTDDEWTRRLEAHLWERSVGPWLWRERSRLDGAGREVVAFWEASRQACAWLAGLLLQAASDGRQRRRGVPRRPLGLAFRPEEPLSYEFSDPSWSDSVVVSGVADLVLEVPGRAAWCLVELKLGRACPEADLAQVCFYHRLRAAQDPTCSGDLALVGFTPALVERVFPAAELAEAQHLLAEVAARLAGVTGDAPPRPRRKHAAPAPADDTPARLVALFREYGAEVGLDADPIVGPAFVRVPVRLGPGVKLAAVQRVAAEAQHRLGLAAPPLVSVARGRVVVDLQRADRQAVRFADLRAALPKATPRLGCSSALLGVDLNGALRCVDLAAALDAHVLAAGTTGSGKSEWLRATLAGLLLANTPDTLRLVLVDPKRSAFGDLARSPFLLAPDSLVYPDERPPAEALGALADEMDRRYRILQKAGADTRDSLVERGGGPMPRIVCVIDEYLDLISRGRRDRQAVEEQICRLGAKARAAAIHLIVATQHPSRQVIKGALDANLPARVAFRAAKPLESRLLLGQAGAENLLGAGDLLFKDVGDPVRLQAPLLDEADRRAVFDKAK